MSDHEKSALDIEHDTSSHGGQASVQGVVSAEEAARIKKLDRACTLRLDFSVTLMAALFYLLNFLDRASLGNARVAGLQKDLNLTTHEYLIVTTATYVLYITFELPSNLLLKKVKAQFALPTMVIAWGVIVMCTAAVKNYRGLLAIRLMLGLAEAGLFPGLVLHLSRFYRRDQLQLRNSLFFGSASLAGAFGGLIAAGLVKLHNGLTPWANIFVVEGAITVGVGIIGLFIFPSDVQSCLFLTAEQKTHWRKRLAEDRVDGSNDDDDKFSWAEVVRAFKSPHVIFCFIALFGNGFTIYSLAYFLPTIVSGLGNSPIRTQLLTVPPFAVAFCLSIFNALLSDRYRQRGLCALWTSFLTIVGYAIYLAAGLNKHMRYGALFLMVPGVYSTAPPLISWLPNNSAPHYRRATAVALGFIATNSAGIASTWTYPAKSAPLYRTGAWASLAMTLTIVAGTTANLIYLRYANGVKARRRANGEGGDWAVEGDAHPDFKYSY